MSDLEFEPKIGNRLGFRADALIGHSIFEVLADLRDFRHFRSTLMGLAKILLVDSRFHGILILDGPQISDDRLREEWLGVEPLFRPEILKRITLVIRREDTPDEVVGSLTDIEQNCIEPVSERARQHASRPPRRPSEAFFDILRVLLVHWFRKSGPLTSKELAEQTGFTYPTIANALERLESRVIRYSDRRVELRAFPKEEWSRLVANSDKVRQTLRFADDSGQPRSIESLVSRLENVRTEEIAIGGVMGARHYFSALDLIGTPRLDLTVHFRTHKPNLGFLRKLDPALKPARYEEPARLVIHALRRPHAFFEHSPDGSVWADPVECLLDLHDMRLEPQAAEFLRTLVLKTI